MTRNLLTAAALILAVTIGALCAAPPAPEKAALVAVPEAPRKPAGWWENDASRIVFHAVLQGLYDDGVPQELVDIIIPLTGTIPTENNPQPIGYRDMREHFVYMCPLCHPAYEAFKLYAARTPFEGQKASDLNTFGTGLPAAIVQKLRSDKKTDRIDGVRMAIDRWVKQRLDLMRLSKQERAEWEFKIKALRDEGTKWLKQYQQGGNGGGFGKTYADWKFCPACDGAFGACKLDAAAPLHE